MRDARLDLDEHVDEAIAHHERTIKTCENVAGDFMLG